MQTPPLNPKRSATGLELAAVPARSATGAFSKGAGSIWRVDHEMWVQLHHHQFDLKRGAGNPPTDHDESFLSRVHSAF